MNERNAAEAFAQILSCISGKDFKLASYPDEDNSNNQDVDYLFASDRHDVREVAAEHTIVETFEGQLEYVNMAFQIVKELDRQCEGKLPTDRFFYMAIAHSLVVGMNRPQRIGLIEEMKLLVPAVCQGLQVDDYRKLTHRGHQILVKCEGSFDSMNGHIFHIQWTPENAELLAEKRLARSLSDKLPKLLNYKARGYTTALLLEDIAGSIEGIGAMSSSLLSEHRLQIAQFVDYLARISHTPHEF